MSGTNDNGSSTKNDEPTDSDKIRRDIARAEQEMARTVDEIGDRIKEKMEWQQYVKDTPYLALGVAAGLGYLVSGMFIEKKSSLDRLIDEVRDTAGSLTVQSATPGIIQATVLGIASKAAVNWLQTSAEKTYRLVRENDATRCSTHADSLVDNDSSHHQN